jgi:phage terminase small subunit
MRIEMANTKRARTNSVAGTVAMVKAITTAMPEPTETLTDKEMANYTRLMRSREAGSWSDHDINLATQCAQQMALATEYTARLKQEGPIVYWTTPNGNTKPMANPMLQARSNAFATVSTLTKLLGLSASQKGLSGANQEKRNQADRKAREAIEAASEHDESLI